MPPTSKLIWSSTEPNSEIEVDCLLPTGLLIPIKVKAGSCVSEIKSLLWSVASGFPLYNLLKDVRSYVFVCINQKGKSEELVDENRQLIDVRPFRPLLKLIERKGDREEKLLVSEISCLIGKNLNEFDQMENPEVDEFRKTYRYIAEQISRERNQLSWEERAMYAYPPELENSDEIPAHIEKNLNNSRFILNIVKNAKKNSKKPDVQAFNVQAFNVSIDAYPHELLYLVFSTEKKIDSDSPDDYVLKIVGRESYLLGSHPLFKYKYIRSCVAKGERPLLSLMLRAHLNIHQLLEVAGTQQDANLPPHLPSKASDLSTLSLWNIDTNFKLKVISAANVNASDDMKVCLRAGIYHGAETLCDIKTTSPKDGLILIWDEYLDFEDLKVCDLPRMARLCLVIYGYSTSRRHKQRDTIPLAWVNTTLFDFRNRLRQGKLRLYCWPVRDNMDDLNPIGTVATNINTSTSPFLLIEFQSYANTVVYPSHTKVVDLAASSTPKDFFCLRETEELEQLRQIVDRESLAPIFEQEKELVWLMRIECRERFSYALPKLMNSMKWSCKEDVAQMQILLLTWPEMEAEQALELLDYSYPDQAVRRFAVQCLEKMSDAELMQYLLQLVQVLKYESYLDCELAKFLLKRALWNRSIGHALFWHLRAEMHIPEASIRFGLMLEAYCRGAIAHVKSLSRQVRALDKMTAITKLMRCIDKEKKGEKAAMEAMKQCLLQPTFQEALAKLPSPLEPSHVLLKLRVDECKFMDSKMKPLWMVFENADELADDVRLLFKNGDDLRQDMFTLQLLRLMDTFWQREGLDLGMTPYRCLSTGEMVGLIEVVMHSKTLANIQKRRGGGGVTKGAFDKTSLLRYLKECNPEEESLDKAVEHFTLSCAGYCVATYVLGVGDRHSDNIMVTKDGHLFHIDFGHFLGNFKVMFGVRRERVPFVLTEDFGYVITKGRTDDIEKSDEFQRFKNICIKAFVILRRKGHLLITLFVMMLSTGIPELRSHDDINYLRKTLALSNTEEEAINKFRDKFDEAWRNRWKTNFNWLFHNHRRNNPN